MDFPTITVPRGGIDFNEIAQRRTERHDCPLPDLRTWHAAAEASDDFRAEWWKCPDCGQSWTVAWDSCYECGRRHDEPEAWRTGDLPIGPWSEHGHFYWRTEERPPPDPREPSIATVGGWCAPSEALYGLSLDLQDKGPW